QGLPLASLMAKLKEDISGTLATLQVCITATNLILGAVGEPAMTHVMMVALRPANIVLAPAIAHSLAYATALPLVTLFTVVLSELLPKALALQHAEQIAIWVARPVRILRLLCAPLVPLMMWMSNAVTRAMGLGKVQIEPPVHTEEELEMLVDE